jgi:hypothetical protein
MRVSLSDAAIRNVFQPGVGDGQGEKVDCKPELWFPEWTQKVWTKAKENEQS